MVYFALDGVVSYWYGLVEAGRFAEEVAVVGLVVGEFWVVCTIRLDWSRIHELGLFHGHSSMPTTPRKMSSSSMCS